MEVRDTVKVQIGSQEEVSDDGADQRKRGQNVDPDANAGSDYDVMPVEDNREEVPPAEVGRLLIFLGLREFR